MSALTATIRVPFFRSSAGDREIRAVADCVRSGWLTTGPRTAEFERRFAAAVGAHHAVAVSSCTAAMHLALEASGVKGGDEVIVPTLTFVATAQAALHCGATPVLVDCLHTDFTVDPDAIESAITPRSRAIMPMHYAGHPCDLNRIAGLADAHRLMVIDDAAHALGAGYAGIPIGGSGVCCFSFHATKHLSTGEGGMVTTSDAALAARIRSSRIHGIRRDVWKRYQTVDPWVYDVAGVGHKYNMPDLLAAVGLAQLESFEQDRQRRAHIVSRYRAAFADHEGLTLQSLDRRVVHAHYLFPILLNLETLLVDRDQFMRLLLERGIGSSIHYRPLHLFEDFAPRCRIGPQCTRVSESIYARLLSLPLYARMTDEDVDFVCQVVIDLLRRCRR